MSVSVSALWTSQSLLASIGLFPGRAPLNCDIFSRRIPVGIYVQSVTIMTTFFQAPSAYPDTAYGTAVNVKAYDLRLEVNVEDSAKSVPVVKIFRQLLVQLAATAGDPIEVSIFMVQL